MSDITGIASLMLWTDAERFPALRNFYVEQVGLLPDSDRSERVAFSWGTPPHHMRLIISVHSEVNGPNRDPNRLMLNFLVEDAQAVAARLRAAGVDVDEPRQQGWGGWVATFHDPDGNTVQLLQSTL